MKNYSESKPALFTGNSLEMLGKSITDRFGNRYDGLGLLKGRVISMDGVIPENLQIPHIGWNNLHFHGTPSPLFKYIRNHDCVYFVHSYFATGCEESLAASTEYGAELTAAVAKDNVFGCQFHPEKSGDVGLNILRAFLEV